MRIVMVAVGSRGDVQPCAALAAALERAGHAVRLAVPAALAGLVEPHCGDVAGLPIDPSGLLEGDMGRAWVESGRDPVAFIRGLRRLGLVLGEPLADAVLGACEGADAIIYTTLAFPAWHVAAARGVPAVQVGFAPLTPTAAHPPVLFPDLFDAWAGRAARSGEPGARLRRSDPWRRAPSAALARAYHRGGHWLFAQMLWLPMRRRLNAWRRGRLGAPPLGWRSPGLQVEDGGEPLLAAFSPTVLPPPPDWGEHVTTTGYWFLDTPPHRRLPEEVERFLAAGPPPVSVGMGSMTGRDPQRMTAVLVEALRRTGQRGLLLSGWAGLGAALRRSALAGVDLLVVDEVPHDLLFPRVRAVVHHGGAGTTGAALRAGVPNVVIPHFGDQPLWGDRVHALGAGPAPIARRDLRARRLAHALSAAVHDRRIARCAAAVGRAIRAERGVEVAVERIERVLAAAAR